MFTGLIAFAGSCIVGLAFYLALPDPRDAIFFGLAFPGVTLIGIALWMLVNTGAYKVNVP